MYPYRYQLSIRAKHPAMPASKITEALNLTPKLARDAGAPRETPKGQPLEGTYVESLWMAKPCGVDAIESEDRALESVLAEVLQVLGPQAANLAEFRDSGGHLEVFIGLFGSKNFGFELPSPLLASCASLGLALSFDIYP